MGGGGLWCHSILMTHLPKAGGDRWHKAGEEGVPEGERGPDMVSGGDGWMGLWGWLNGWMLDGSGGEGEMARGCEDAGGGCGASAWEGCIG